MKQRITYVVTNPEEFRPEHIKVAEHENGHRFQLQGIRAAKEHRITLGLDELPSEVC